MADLRSHLIDIRTKYGELTPRRIVDEARDPGHPLHGEFEWDDTVAADRFRLTEAGRLVVRCRLSFSRASGEVASIQEFHALSRQGPSNYESVSEIRDDPLKRAMLLRQAEHEWRHLKLRWESLAEYLDWHPDGE